MFVNLLLKNGIPLLVCACALSLTAKTPDPSIFKNLADFERSVALRDNWKTLTREVIFPVSWVSDSHEFYYRKSVESGFHFYIQNVDTGAVRSAFDHNKLATALSEATGEPVSAENLPFADFRYTREGKAIRFSMHYEAWEWELDGNICQRAADPIQRPKAFWAVRDLRVSRDEVVNASSDDNFQARVENYNLVITNKQGEIVFATQDGSEDNFYDIDSVVWSPDNQALTAVRVEPGEANLVTRVLTAPEDQLQPKVITQLYPKPGDRVDIDQPVLIDLASGQQFQIDNRLFPAPFMLSDFYWRTDSQSFAFHYIERGHQRERLIEVRRADGDARVLINETSPTFINACPTLFDEWRLGLYHDVNRSGAELIWLSERSGWAHLYLYDGKTGKVINPITEGDWPVRDLVHVDAEKRQVYFAASGMNKGEDPYYEHYYRVNFDGSGLLELTPEPAYHEARFSDDMQYYVDVYSRVDLPNVAKLYRTGNAEPLATLAKGDISPLSAAGFNFPDTFIAKGRDGQTDIWGIIVKPTDFDPDRRYPVIENIYAGPHDSFVPKSFWPFGYHHGGDKVIGMQALADLGFIVVQMDGMGTANRSKAFHDVAWQNLGDSGFPDRILWHKAAAAQYPWYNIDAGVGIYGASAGGQNTAGALFFHPDFYTVGVAYAGCYDNRMDKINWNEQWMGYPVGPEYAASSATEHAANLQGKLFIINGEQDSNVDPASTMQLVDALVKANKEFDLLIVPGGEHSVGRSTGPIDYIQRRQFAFFVENLARQPLPDWNRAAQAN